MILVPNLLATYVSHPIGSNKTSQDQNYEVEMKKLADSKFRELQRNQSRLKRCKAADGAASD